jgi:hypothetical protein
MPRPRIGFLPAFFAVLSIVFAIAVVMRIRSYNDEAPETTSTSSTSRGPLGGSAPATSDFVRERSDPGVIVEGPAGRTSRPNSALVAGRTATSPAELTTPSPQPATAAQPSFLERMIAPVVNALGGGAPATPPSVARAQNRPPADPNARGVDRSGSSSSSSSSSTSSTPDQSTDTTGPARAEDGTSDSTAPQLAAIEFIPPQVADGEETMLVVIANDDLTGVQSISGTIVAPSGAVQGFACQREGDTNRFQSRITVPREAAEGLWRVNYISLVDRASNASTLTAQMGTVPPSAAFRVTSSRPDSEGPTLRAIWIDRRAMRGGEKNTVFVDAADERSGVQLVTGVFQSPSKFARVGFICKSGSTWNCEITAPICADCGDWTLEQVQLQDKANNMTTIRGDNQLVSGIHIDISSDSCDATPPALESMLLSTNVVSNAADSNITVTATLSDDACGVLSVSGQAVGPTTSGPPPRRYFSLAVAGDGRTWSGNLTIPRLASKGVWRISFVQVLDRGHNLKTYGQGDVVLGNAAFTVQ